MSGGVAAGKRAVAQAAIIIFPRGRLTSWGTCVSVARMNAQTPHPPENYESALKELEVLLARLEDGRLSLEESIETYRRGLFLLGFCQTQLADAEQRIQVLEGGSLKNFQNHEDT